MKVDSQPPIARLGELTDLISSGSTPLGGSEVYLTQGPVMLIRSQNVQMNRLELDDVAFITDQIDSEMIRSRVKCGDVFLNITGASIGRVAAFERKDTRANVNQHVCIIRPKADRLCSRYLTHLISSPAFQAKIESLQHGGTRQALTFRTIADFEIPLLPLQEQRKIAAILDQADALRGKRVHALTRLDKLSQSLFLELFGDPTTNPKGWPAIEFQKVVYFQEGPGIRNWQFRDKGIKLVNVRNVVNGVLTTENTERYLDPNEVESRYQHFLLDCGDFVMASSGVTWGKIAEVEQSHLPLCLNTSMIRIRPLDDRILKPFLRAFIESPSFKRQIVRLITGSAQPNFGPAHLKQVLIPLPSLAAQREFSDQITVVKQLQAAQQASQIKLNALFASLQHRAFRGEL